MASSIKEILRMPLRVLRGMKQNSPEWFEVRRRHRTASETPIVMGLLPWITPGKLAMEKFSKDPPKMVKNFATEHGHKYEPRARELYERKFGEEMEPECIVRGPYMASLDGWSRDRKLVLEMKCPVSQVYGKLWQQVIDGEIPDYYFYQIQHQLMVSGSPLCHFFAYVSKSDKAVMIEVERQPKCFPEIHDHWERFIRKYG